MVLGKLDMRIYRRIKLDPSTIYKDGLKANIRYETITLERNGKT